MNDLKAKDDDASVSNRIGLKLGAGSGYPRLSARAIHDFATKNESWVECIHHINTRQPNQPNHA
jgi:hypothetical protein